MYRLELINEHHTECNGQIIAFIKLQISGCRDKLHTFTGTGTGTGTGSVGT